MTRLSVNINDETTAALREIAANRGTTVTEVVRRAVSVYDFLATEQAKGQRLRLVDEDGTLTYVEFV